MGTDKEPNKEPEIVLHFWLTFEAPIDEGKFVAALLNKGYDVFSAAESNELILKSEEGASFGIISGRLTGKNKPVSQVYDIFIDILNEQKINYYSIIISEFSVNSIWNVGIVSSKSNKQVQIKKPIN